MGVASFLSLVVVLLELVSCCLLLPKDARC